MASSLNVGQVTVRMGSPLQQAPEREEEVIESGDFRIDLFSHRVTVCGREVKLSPEEFDMLVFLARHPRRVVTPSSVAGARSGEPEVRQTQFLRVLAALRRKIEEVAGRRGYIRTEPWVFYRFDPGV